MIYSKQNPTWTDESGTQIPVSRITGLESRKEKTAARLLKGAQAINSRLAEFKTEFDMACQAIYEQAMKEADADATKSKGNFTWFSFDRSIRIEKSINERIDFDDALIDAAKQKLNQYITKNMSDKDEALLALVNSAFETSRGKLDAKKVLSLLKFKSKIKAQLFQDAMELIEKAIRRPDSKTYYRISEKQADGSYKVVDLNFSSI